MTGRAVVTTRLSRATMNSAIDVMMNVQSAFERVRVIRRTPFQCYDLVVTKYGGEKRGRPRSSGGASASGAIAWCSSNPLRDHVSGEPPISRAAATFRSIPSAKKRWISSSDAPLSRSTASIQTRRTPRERPAGRPRRHTPRRPGAGRAADPDRRGAACRRGPSGRGSSTPDRPRGRRLAASWKTSRVRCEAVADDGEEQFPLRPEQLEQVRLRDTDRVARSTPSRCRCSRPGELATRPRRRSRPGARRRSGGRGGRGVHGSNLVSTK